MCRSGAATASEASYSWGVDNRERGFKLWLLTRSHDCVISDVCQGRENRFHHQLFVMAWNRFKTQHPL
ncbi:hypothetical protein WJX79_006610 [Trebouxia sp. C0005]